MSEVIVASGLPSAYCRACVDGMDVACIVRRRRMLNVMLQEIGRRPPCTLIRPGEWRHKQRAQSLVLSRGISFWCTGFARPQWLHMCKSNDFSESFCAY